MSTESLRMSSKTCRASAAVDARGSVVAVAGISVASIAAPVAGDVGVAVGCFELPPLHAHSASVMAMATASCASGTRDRCALCDLDVDVSRGWGRPAISGAACYG